MKYFIKIFDLLEMEVTKEQFIELEEFCGFYSKTKGEPATWDFGLSKNGIKIKGRQQDDMEPTPPIPPNPLPIPPNIPSEWPNGSFGD